LPSGIKYKIVKKGTGKRTAKMNDHIAIKMKGTAAGTVIFDTKQINKGVDQYVYFQIKPKQFNGDMIEGLMYLHDGDSAVFHIPQDSFFRGNKPKNMKPGEPVIYTVNVLQIKTPTEYKAEQVLLKKQQAEFAKQQAEFKKQQAQMKKQMEAQKKAQNAAIAQKKKDDKSIKKYLDSLGIVNYKKTNSGLYYIITQEGIGALPAKGDELNMNYTGQLLNGKKFDSNIEPEFNHVSPFTFPLGQGRVIAGWEEGIALLNKGAKATLLIPSSLAYGATGSGANIPPNSPLRFDVEVIDFKKSITPEEQKAIDDQALQAYFSENKIMPMKTASGLYYTINTTGQGPIGEKGNELTMNYTGKLLNGTKFDSNVDSAFNHVQPFNFKLGTGSVIAGWDEAMALFPQGTKATIFLPSGLAYGKSGSGSIPANSPLIFDVEVLEVKK
jgi:FKBP-type peptidyl-prolyl cis-trans isomerase